MDTSQANDQAGAAKPASKPSIDSLRTVEFRTTLRGYHMDDVDEYLERVAVEAEGLQEQMRLSSERLKQAGERVTSLEQQLEQARKVQQSTPATELVDRVEHVEVADDSLQRTLLLAQKFVDQTRQQAEDEANALVTESEERARVIVADAEEHARVLTEDAERSLRDEVKRLDTLRAELVGDVETIARHLEGERSKDPKGPHRHGRMGRRARSAAKVRWHSRWRRPQGDTNGWNGADSGGEERRIATFEASTDRAARIRCPPIKCGPDSGTTESRYTRGRVERGAGTTDRANPCVARCLDRSGRPRRSFGPARHDYHGRLEP